jgi:N-acetyl-anhydromuramyl-L-alanine amidase AmpD
MRYIDTIIIHCSATEQGRNFDATDIRRWHKERGFSDIGYHYVVKLDGTVEHGRDIELVGSHCLGYNKTSIGICYIGGLKDGNPADTRTPEQRVALAELVASLLVSYPSIITIVGHNQLNPNKACPCYNVPEWLSALGIKELPW